MYGALQGLDKAETAAKHGNFTELGSTKLSVVLNGFSFLRACPTVSTDVLGDDQVKIWRRAYAIPPPALDEKSPVLQPREFSFAFSPVSLPLLLVPYELPQANR